jgi:S-DNA-T family DNA segregation ATPase FtsK/SpoIIIE
MLDNYAAFSNTYEDLEESLADVAREAGNLGIHLILTANSSMGIRTRVASNIVMSIALHLADQGEYGTVVGRTQGLEPAPIPGRGLIKGNPPLEFQAALPVPGETEVERTASLRALVDRIRVSWSGPTAHAVRTLPAATGLCDLLPDRATWPDNVTADTPVAIGLDAEEIEPFTISLNDGPYFLISGPVQGGKTTLLQRWLLALAETLPPERLQLCLLPQVVATVHDDATLTAVLEGLDNALQARRADLEAARAEVGTSFDEAGWLAERSKIVLAIDPFDAFSEQTFDNKDRLEELLRRDRALGLHVLMAGATSEISSSYDGLLKAIRELQTGFLLGGCDFDDLQLFNLRLGLGEAGKVLPPGQGLVTRRGRYRRIQAASAHVGSVTINGLVDRIIARHAAKVASEQAPEAV